MIRISGSGATTSELPITLEAARLYFQDTAMFLDKIEAVDVVKPLARPGAFLITHNPVGGLNYKVVLVTCLQAEWHEGGLRLVALDFDLDKISCPFPTVKGFSESQLDLVPRGERTGLDFKFKMDIELPLAGALKFLPRPIVQATADGIMQFEAGRVVRNLFTKVLSDFHQEAVR
ncbi:MAG: hypothetical protein JWM80_2284 [Cyanobacteria bacterium RYN_339]|nr:hypothetical protein [Cyanobacteria bacterium RYN_339]